MKIGKKGQDQIVETDKGPSSTRRDRSEVGKGLTMAEMVAPGAPPPLVMPPHIIKMSPSPRSPRIAVFVLLILGNSGSRVRPHQRANPPRPFLFVPVRSPDRRRRLITAGNSCTAMTGLLRHFNQSIMHSRCARSTIHPYISDAISSSLSIMRRMPPNKIEQNLSGLTTLMPDATEELLQRVDQPLEEATCAVSE